MNRWFVDTSAFVALTNRKDRNHATAKRTLRRAERDGIPLLTSDYVMDEVITLLRMRMGHDVAVRVGEALLHSRWCDLAEIHEDVRLAAWGLFRRYHDQTFSFTDCTSFALMTRFRLDTAFTFDRQDFSAAGFRVAVD